MSGYAALLEGARVSPFLDTNELLAPQVLNLRRETEQRNALLSQQELGLRQQEFGLRQSEFGLKQQDAAAAREAARRAIAGLGGDGSTGTAGTTPGFGGQSFNLTMPPEYAAHYAEAEKETGIPAAVLMAKDRQESGFNPGATGGAGEIGIAQIHPKTAASPGYGMTGVRNPDELRDPRSNILFGARYLKARAGNTDWSDPAQVAAALRAYNGGGDPQYAEHVMRYIPGGGTATAAATPGATGGAAPGPDAQAAMTDQQWLEQQAKTYPSLAGPNVNQQAGTQPSEAPGGPPTPAPYQVASLKPEPPPSPTAPAAATPTGTLGLETKPDGSVGTPNAGGLATPQPQPSPPAAPPAALPSPGPQAPAPVAPPALGPHNLTHDDVRRFTDQLVTARTPEQVHAVMNDIEATKQRNIANQHQYQQDLYARQKDAEATAQRQLENRRQAEADARAQQAAALEAPLKQAQLTEAQRKAQAAEQAQREPLFQGQGTDIQDYHILHYSDPGSAEYHEAYARQARPKLGEGGVIVKPNMDAYRTPLDKDGQPVTTLDQSHITIGPGQLGELRKMETQASGLTSALDDFAKTARKASTTEKLATLAGASTDLGSAWTNAGLMAKGEALFNLGVLSGPDMTVIRGALADPHTASGWWASNETIDKQVNRIKQLLETRIDQARRSYGGGMSPGGAASGRPAEQSGGGGGNRPPLSSFTR